MPATDWCGVCGEPLRILAHGAYAECHGGRSYWSVFPAYPGDPAFRRYLDPATGEAKRVYFYFRLPVGQRVI